jgi:hypothetical protein
MSISCFLLGVDMKTKLFLISLIFFLTSPSIIYAQFHLEIGNRWDYVEGWWDGSGSSDADTIVYTVVSDTLLDNGKTYYKILPEGSVFFRNLIRSDSVGIYYYDIVCDTEWLYYNYALPIGQFSYVPEQICDTTNSPIIYKLSEDSTYIFGNTIFSMTYDYEGGIDIFYLIKLTQEFGFIEWQSASFSENYFKHLLGCNLSGTVYGILTDIEDDDKAIFNYSLQQNYPNPFNPNTFIEFSIPSEQIVILKIYDILGNEVTELLNENKKPGNYKIEFNATKLSSGIYFYQLQTNSNILTNKMVLLK